MCIRVEQVLADGDYELVPAGGEGQAEGEVNAVQVEQDPNAAAKEPQANTVPEGKPRSMSYVSTQCDYVLLSLCLSIYVSGVELKP